MPTISELQRAIQISEQIQKLEAELASALNWISSGKSTNPSPKRGRPRKLQQADGGGSEAGNGRSTGKRKRKMSAEGRAKIAAAQRARWAKQKGTAGPATAVAIEEPAAKKKRKLSPEARARIVAAVKARWAKKKK